MPMSHSIDNITAPLALNDLKGWLCWRFEKKHGVEKLLKVPYYTNGKRRSGKQGSPEDLAQLTDFETAKKAAIEAGMTGVGFAPYKGCGITILDYDNCVKEGELDTSVAFMVANTYAEYSPSGNGVHAIVTGNLGNRRSHSTRDQYGFETFADKGFVTFTGDILPINELTGNMDIAPPSDGVLALYAQRFPDIEWLEKYTHDDTRLGLIDADIDRLLDNIPPDIGFEDWLRVGMALHHELNGGGFELWDSWSARGSKYRGQDDLRVHWNTFGRSDSTRPITARALIRLSNQYGNVFKQTLVTDDDFEVIEDCSEPTDFFKIRSVYDFVNQTKPLEWLIKGFLPKATLGVLYGESGSGKSFLALDICQTLLRAQSWNGLKSRPVSKILYIAAEGVIGLANRIRAYAHQYALDISKQRLDVISDAPPNFTDADSVGRLISDIDSRKGYDLIIVDTFAQVTPGANENSGEDMGKALAYCRRISAVAQGMVLLIHHSGKDASKGARGWSGVHAASDVVLEISREGDQRAIAVTKQKDGSDGAKYGFKLLPVVLEQDEDGDDVTSCVIEYCEYKPSEKQEPKKNKRVGQLEHIILTVLRKNPSGMAHMDQEDLITEAAQKLPYTGEGRDKRKYRIARALETLCESGLVLIENGRVFILDGDGNGTAA